MKKKTSTVFAAFLLAGLALSASEANEARKALNIVNFVRSAKRADGTAATVRFEEGRIVVTGSSLDAEYEENFRRKIAIGDGGINFVFQGFRYRVPVCGAVQSTNKGFRISGDRIELDLSCADR